MAIPAAAQVACAPVIAGISGTVSLVAAPANLLAEPAVAPATVLGVVAAVASAVWPAGAAFVAWLGSWPARWLVAVAGAGARVPDGVMAWPAGTGGAWRDRRQPVVQGRSLSGLSTAQMCLIRSPATWNANTVTVTPSC